MKIYFAGSIRGGRKDVGIYKRLVDYLSTLGEVLTAHVANKNITAYGEHGFDEFSIYNRDMEWLKHADVLIAEVSNPSLGVGYELARAEKRKLPVLCLYRPQKGKRLSAMITGNRNFLVRQYSTLKEAIVAINKFLKKK